MTRLISIYFAVGVGLLCTSCIEKPIQDLSELPTQEISQSHSVRKLQKELGAGDAFIKYQFQNHSQELSVKVIDAKSSQSYTIELPSNFKSKLDDFYTLVQQFTLPKKVKRRQFIQESTVLYNILISPIEKAISSKERLIIVSEDKLQRLPFEVLVSSDRMLAYSDLDYLLKNHSISYHLSESAFLKSKQANRKKWFSFLGFAPGFESVALASNDLSQNEVYRNKVIQALPHSRKEVLGLANIVQSRIRMKSQTALGEQASESWLKSELQKEHDLVHIASHSFADFKNSMQSGILCSENATGDGVLRVSEISKLKIDSDLVVLSSCESGVGKIDKDKNVAGIHKSFLEAGASNVVYSLWKVNDKVSSDFMLDFYEHFLTDEENYSKALREAKLKLIKNKSTSSPNLWAPFVLMGR